MVLGMTNSKHLVVSLLYHDQKIMFYRAKNDIAAAGPDPELLTLPGLSAY